MPNTVCFFANSGPRIGSEYVVPEAGPVHISVTLNHIISGNKEKTIGTKMITWSYKRPYPILHPDISSTKGDIVVFSLLEDGKYKYIYQNGPHSSNFITIELRGDKTEYIDVGGIHPDGTIPWYQVQFL